MKEKQIRQNYWLSKNNYTLVSTNAFGMGIDKDDVGFVIHLSPSPSIENYYQEIGRAGRNGQNAETILLWNQSELTQIDDLIKSQLASKTDYQKVCSYVYSFVRLQNMSFRKVSLKFKPIRFRILLKFPVPK